MLANDEDLEPRTAWPRDYKTTAELRVLLMDSAAGAKDDRIMAVANAHPCPRHLWSHLLVIDEAHVLPVGLWNHDRDDGSCLDECEHLERPVVAWAHRQEESPGRREWFEGVEGKRADGNRVALPVGIEPSALGRPAPPYDFGVRRTRIVSSTRSAVPEDRDGRRGSHNRGERHVTRSHPDRYVPADSSGPQAIEAAPPS